jgi:hypothetical protein
LPEADFANPAGNTPKVVPVAVTNGITAESGAYGNHRASQWIKRRTAY